MAMVDDSWVDALLDLLVHDRAPEAMAVLQRTFGPSPGFAVALVALDLPPLEALYFARDLSAYGRDDAARGVLLEVLRHAAGEASPLALAGLVAPVAVAA